MRRLRHFFVVAAVATTVLLSGCTSFTPVYEGGSSNGLAASRFNFVAPSDHLDQIVLNRLRSVFPDPAGPNDPVLAVTTSTASPWAGYSNAIPAGRPAGIRVTAKVTISQDNVEIFSATRFSDTTYQGGSVSPVDVASSTGAYEVAAKSVAESLRAAILAGYRPMSHPLQR